MARSLQSAETDQHGNFADHQCVTAETFYPLTILRSTGDVITQLPNRHLGEFPCT